MNSFARGVRRAALLVSLSALGLTGCGGGGSSGPALQSIEVTPPNSQAAAGTTAQFAATAILSDGSHQDVTSQVTWASTNTAVATISNATPKQGLASAVKVGSTTISASFNGKTGSTGFAVTAAALTSIGVTPANPSVAKGQTEQFTATGTFTDGSTQDLTTQVTWASSNTAATISNTAGSNGIATTAAIGTTTISATSGNVSGSTTLTVTPAVLTSIGVTPPSPSIAKGLTQQFTATGVFSDNSTQDLTTQVTWASSSSSVASISNASGSQGLASSIASGSTTISAASGSISGSTTLTVTAATLMSIQVSPAKPSVAKGLTQQFTATGVFSDNTTQNLTTQVTWASSSTGVATVSNASGSQGLASTAGTGSTTISAASGGVSGNATLTVTAAALTNIQITPANPSVAKGLTQRFAAAGTFTDGTSQDLTTQVTWVSSNTAVATISNAAGSQGLANTVATGTTAISAASGSVSGSTTLTVTAATLASVQVTPANSTVAKGTTQQFTATGIFTDNTRQNLTTTVTWASSDTSIAPISNSSGSQGLAAASSMGTATISASSGSVSGSTALTVSAANLVSIQVTSPSSKLAAGFSLQFTATGVYSDNSTQDITGQVTWVSTNSNAATISNASGSQGLAAGQAVGSTSIVAQSGSIQASKSLAVTNATLSKITVTPPNQTLPNGRTLQYAATGTFSDNSTQDLTTQVTWSSSATSVATVSSAAGSQGQAKAAASSGSTMIAAQNGTVSGSTTLTASNADLVSVKVSPDTATVAKGVNQKFQAQGTFSDGTSGDVTGQVTWSSSQSSVATISNASGSAGLASTVGTGTTTIGAQGTDSSGHAVSGSSTLTVTAATLASIAVTPASDKVPLGVQVQYKAVGTYSDGTTQDLTTQVTWASNTTSVATISNASSTQGLASTVGTGSTTISAASGSISNSATLTVTSATLSSIAVTPATPTVGTGTTQQFTASGTYTDSTTQDLTTQVTWSSSNTAVADISNSTGSQGRAFANTQGQTTITAVDPATQKSGNATLAVGPAVLQSISISPAPHDTDDGLVPQGYQERFLAIGLYSDNSKQDLTASASWTSFNSNVLSVSDATDSKGLAAGVAAGSTTIAARVGQLSASKNLTVSNETLSSIAVTPATQTLHGANQTQQYLAVGSFSGGSSLDLTTQVNWASSDTNTATISNTAGSQGLATSKQVVVSTTVIINGTLNGKTGSASLTVAPF